MVALYTARICEFFVKRLCSGLWSGSFSVFCPSHPYFLPPLPSLFSSIHCFISVTGAWNGCSWLGCGDLPAMGAAFYLGAGWPQWKPLGIPGAHLPLKRGSWLFYFPMKVARTTFIIAGGGGIPGPRGVHINRVYSIFRETIN